jgi:hypothetical protein
MPCPFTGLKMFCAGPNFLSQIKNVFTYCGSHKHFVADKKMTFSKVGFCAGTKCSQIFGLTQKFGPAQNILGPVKRQDISLWPIQSNRHLT